MKKRRRITSIYCIECLINNKKYIGQSIFTQRRFREHKKDFRDNNHDNPYLQNTYNKYGLENFKFYILEEFDPSITAEELTEKEKYYVKLHKSDDKRFGYNMGEIISTHISRGRKMSEERRQWFIKNVIPLSHKVPRIWTKEMREDLSKKKMGYHHTEETKRKQSRIRKEHFESITPIERSLPYNHKKKIYYLLSPEEIPYKIIGIRKFCQEFSLDRAALYRVYNKKKNITHHYGWTKFEGNIENTEFIIKDYTK